VVLGAGALAVVLGLVANSRRDPDTVTWGKAAFLVKRRDLGQAVAIDFLRRGDGVVAESIAGRTDLVCEPPHLMLIDLDGDGETEVYFTTCDESGFVAYRGGEQLEAVQLSEFEVAQLRVLHSFWFRQLQDGGWNLLLWGLLGALLGAVGLGTTVLFSRFGKPGASRRP
jgi:hypothetical protein